MRTETRESIVLENEGQKIFGVLHKPLGAGKFPAVVMFHGLAGQKTGKGRLYVKLSELLAQNGIASLRIDFRGSGDSEGTFEETTLASQVSDALKAIHFLQEQPDIDRDRLGLFGRSLGGLIAVLAAAANGPVHSIALWAPIYDGEQWMERWRVRDPNDPLMVIDGQTVGLPLFEELFALNMKEKLAKIPHIPLLHVHGLKDQIVALSQADNYQRDRRQATAETEFIRLPRSDHEFSHIEERASLIQTTLAWFKKTCL